MSVDTTAGGTATVVEAPNAAATGDAAQQPNEAATTTPSTTDETPNWGELFKKSKPPKDAIAALLADDEDYRKEATRNVRKTEVTRLANEMAKELAKDRDTALEAANKRAADLAAELERQKLLGMNDAERHTYELSKRAETAEQRASRLEAQFNAIQQAVEEEEVFEKISERYTLTDEEKGDLAKTFRERGEGRYERIPLMAADLIAERSKKSMSGLDKTIKSLEERMAAYERTQSGASNNNAVVSGSAGNALNTDDAVVAAYRADPANPQNKAAMAALMKRWDG